jgi:hypothetical protein
LPELCSSEISRTQKYPPILEAKLPGGVVLDCGCIEFSFHFDGREPHPAQLAGHLAYTRQSCRILDNLFCLVVNADNIFPGFEQEAVLCGIGSALKYSDDGHLNASFPELIQILFRRLLVRDDLVDRRNRNDS